MYDDDADSDDDNDDDNDDDDATLPKLPYAVEKECLVSCVWSWRTSVGREVGRYFFSCFCFADCTPYSHHCALLCLSFLACNDL